MEDPPLPARTRILIPVALLTLAALAVALWLLARAPCWQVGAPILCHVDTDRRIVALSFDDGPTPQGLDTILPVLASRNIRATFFLIGGEVEKHPGLARRLAAAGHEIGNHSYSHQRMWFHLPGWYDAEIARTHAALRREGIIPSRLFRPPYGKKLIGLPAAVDRAGLLTVTWDVQEPATTDPAVYARRMLDQVRPGSILLVHAMVRGRETERRALPLLLDGLRDKGYQIVPVGTLMASPSQESEHVHHLLHQSHVAGADRPLDAGGSRRNL